MVLLFFFFKQKTAYEIPKRDWSSDVCSSDLSIIMATIIDGKAVARALQAEIKDEVEGLKRRWGMSPGLGVVLVGDDPASHLYVKNKEKACKEVGIRSEEH